MPQDNTLGAPTEGLGQRVTFAFDAPGSVPMVQAAPRGRINADVRTGGLAGGAAQADPLIQQQRDPTLDALFKIADPIMRADMKRRQTEAFVVGMQRAMQGEAVADIADEQPWYSKLFGDSDVVEGARAYAGQTVAQTTIAAMEDKMPEIRKMAPAEAQRFFVESVNSNLTGDTASDASILQAMTRALPGVMRRQAKEHYGWQQENATRAEAESFRAGADRLQKSAKGLNQGYVTPEEFSALSDQFIRSLMPAAGRDAENYKKSMTSNLVGWAQTGNFHPLNALRDRDFFSVLDPDQRNQVERAIETGEGKLRAKYSFAWNDQLAQVEAQARRPLEGQTTKDIAKQVDALNQQFMNETGSKQGLITPDSRAAMLTGSAVEIAKEKDRQAEKAWTEAQKRRADGDKAAEQATMDLVIQQRAEEGTLGTLSANSKYTNDKISEVAVPLYQAKSPQERIKFLVNNMRENYVISPIRNVLEGQITAALSEEQFTPQVQQAFDQYVAMREANKFVADAYYEKYKFQLAGLYNDVKNGAAPAGAFRDRFVGPGSRSKLDKDEMKAALDVVNSEHNLFMRAFAGEQKLRPGTARRIVNEVSEAAERFAGATGNFKDSFERALHAAKRNGLEIVGGYAWQNGKGQKPLFDYLTSSTGPAGEAPVATDKLNDEVALAVDELLYGRDDKAGILPDAPTDTVMLRLPDKGGVPVFHVQSVVDGQVYDGVLVASDIYKMAATRREKLKSDAHFGPKITYRPDPDAPSLFAGEEAWAAYRARQAARKAKQP